MHNFYVSRIKDRFNDSNTQVIKATKAATNEILGFICWTIEYASNDKSVSEERLPDLNATASQLPPDFLDMGFIKFYTERLEVEALKNNLMKGHTLLCVLPPSIPLPNP